MADSAEVTDFYFQNCRKFRIFDATNSLEFDKTYTGNRLAVSSQCGVTFAVVSKNKIICFPTKSIIDAKITKENMNVEVKDLQVKQIEISSIQAINDIGINCDGSVLAILHTVGSNVFLDFFFIKTLCSAAGNYQYFCRVRVGTDDTNRGCVIGWNPAFADTIAATSTDRSVLVLKLDMKDPSKQSVIGAKKLGAIGTAISWSPKGKQLTIGDSVGKIIQLKPELDVVRSILPPQHQPEYLRITGLCWLATTEWIASFALDSEGKDHETYLVKCKKDKPTEWVLLNELSYSNEKSPLFAHLLTSTELLVDWNVVLTGNSKTSQVVPVGKLNNDWQTWTVDEGKEIYFPVSSNRLDTFPIGIAIDRSMNEQITLGFDANSKKHQPSPLIICMTNDGILTAHYVISNYPAHKSVQISSEVVQFANLSSASQCQTPSKVEPETPVAPQVAKTPIVQKPLMNTPIAAVNSNQLEKTPSMKTQEISIATPITSKAPVKPEESPQQAKDAKVTEAKMKLLEYIDKLASIRQQSRDEIGKLTFGVQNMKRSVLECVDVVKSSIDDSKDVVEELKVLICSMEEMAEKTKNTLKEVDFEVESKIECLEELGDAELMIEKLRSGYESEKLMRFNKLETSVDDLNNKFVECDGILKKLKIQFSENESLSKATVLSPLRNEFNKIGSGKETEMALKVMRNITKIVMDTKDKIHRNELEISIMKKSVAKKDANCSILTANREDIPVFQIGSVVNKNSSEKLEDCQIISARNSLINGLRKKGDVKTKTVKVQRYHPDHFGKIAKPRDYLNTTSLTEAILQFNQTPRRVMATSSIFATSSPSTKCDATTQASEPPIVEKVIVTVESPVVRAQPPTKPITVSSSFSNKTETTISTSTSPLQPTQKLFEKPTTVIPKIETAKENENSVTKSLFGIKKDETVKKDIDETKKITETENAKKDEIKKEVETTSEPEKTPVEKPKENTTVVTEQKPETTDESSKPKEPSFSFLNPPVTPKTTKEENASTPSPASSLFGKSTNANTTPSTTPSTFGSFGQKPAEQKTSEPAKPNENSKSPSQISFSFNSSASKPANTENKPAFGGFGNLTSTNKTTGFAASAAAAAAQANADEGMEDDSMAQTNNGGGGGVSFGGGGGFMSGLGNAAPSTNTTSNIFGSKPAASTSGSSNSWLFGGKTNQQSQPTSFSFANAAAQQAQKNPTQSSSVFGGAPKFGGAPAFGAKPFGGSPSSGGGALSKNASIFGGAAGASGGFAQFASNSGGSVFGGGTSSNNQGGSSIFGGSAKPAAPSGQSIFGGGTSTNKPSSFNTWR